MPLPTPDPAFRWSHEPWGYALRCQPLESVAQHLFTTRQLELRPADDQARRWQQVVDSVGGDTDRLFRIKQVHGRHVRVVDRKHVEADAAARRPEADAIVSDVPGAVLAVQVADCIPMLMVDPRTGAAGAVHAGWRGTCAGIAAETIATLAREFGARPEDLLVGVGPSIGACCYEVGAELVDAFRTAGASDDQLSRWFMPRSGRLRLDLWTANREQLTDAGVQPDHIYLSALCTRTHSDLFDSYRADGVNAGRMVAAIRVPRGATAG
jgi:YfiH family protein